MMSFGGVVFLAREILSGHLMNQNSMIDINDLSYRGPVQIYSKIKIFLFVVQKDYASENFGEVLVLPKWGKSLRLKES